jgi:hypothetical protein
MQEHKSKGSRISASILLSVASSFTAIDKTDIVLIKASQETLVEALVE